MRSGHLEPPDQHAVDDLLAPAAPIVDPRLDVDASPGQAGRDLAGVCLDPAERRGVARTDQDDSQNDLPSVSMRTRLGGRLRWVAASILLAATALSGCGSADSVQSADRAPVTGLKVMNYYPAQHGWAAMWTQYSHADLDRDFAAIADLGADTVRLIVQPAGVGWPRPSGTGADHLRDAVATARAHGLGVMLTLFDQWSDYADVADSRTWLAGVVDSLRVAGLDHIRLIEVQNEIDPTKPNALDWAKAMLAALHDTAPHVQRTLSAAGSAPASSLAAVLSLPADLMDVVDVHLYGSYDHMTAVLDAAQADAHGRPVLIGESGMSTGRRETRGSDQAQAAALAGVRQLCAAYRIPDFAPWIYSDFSARGYLKPTLDDDAFFGLRRLDGSWKPAAAVVREMFADRPVPAVNADLDGGFEGEDDRPDADGDLGAWQVSNADGAADAGTTAGSGVGRSRAAFLARTGGTDTSVPAIVQSFPAAGVQRITVTAQARLDSATGNSRVSIAWFRDGRYLGQAESASATAHRSGWQTLSVQSDAPRGATSFTVNLKSEGNRGTVYFDDVMVRQ